jgi:metallophosphoesterase (TIGR00282 family)
MKILFLGDIVGKSGRDAVLKYLPQLQETLEPDCIIVNAENAAHGFGLTPTIAQLLFTAGVDCITTGNHVWAKKELIPLLETDHRVLRPLNYPASAPGQGASVIPARNGEKVLVMNVMGRLFMDPLDDPFAAVDKQLDMHRLGAGVDAIVIDFHAEATSEKMIMGHYCDGRASLVVGTHTHIPTADAQILPGGTAYQSDAGMCGDFDSVIGMQKQPSVDRMVTKLPGERMAPSEGKGTVCGVFVETGQGGLAVTIAPVRIGPRLLTTGHS